MIHNELSIVAGEDRVLALTVVDVNGDPQDLTDCDLYFTVRQSVSDTTAKISKSTSSGIAITSPATAGLANITLAADDSINLAVGPGSSVYYYDVWIVLPGDLNQAIIPMTRFTVVPRISQLT